VAGERIRGNIYYIDAPAGTGKTHFIMQKVVDVTREELSKKLLCITFTNRATNELRERIQKQIVFNELITIGTIHSFLHEYFKRYFLLPESLELYFEVFKDKVAEEISENNKKTINDKENESIHELKETKIESPTNLTLEIIKNKLNKLEYSETQFSDYLAGRLSHDDLIIFVSNLVIRYPILQKVIGEKFDYIFIDECQDTSSDVLRLFYSVASYKKTNVKLYFCGDKMQEIYDAYDGTFEPEFKNMNLTKRLKKNYRSSEEIVLMLSKLYGRLPMDIMPVKGEIGNIPTIYITSNIEDKIVEFNESNENFLALRVFNRSRFERSNKSEDMRNLFNSYNKLIPYGAKISLIDVLMPIEKDSSPDYLLNILWKTNYIIESFEKKQYSFAIQQIKKYPKIFNVDKLRINYHNDKEELEYILIQVSNKYRAENHNYSISDFFLELEDLKFYKSGLYQDLTEREHDNKNTYVDVLKVPLQEFQNLVRYNRQPDISTQHGVKGEGHEKVLFILEDSERYSPYLYMYDFLEMFVLFDDYFKNNKQKLEDEILFSFYDFQEFKYSFCNAVSKLEKKIGLKISKIKEDDIEKNLADISELINDFIGNPYYIWIYGKRLMRKNKTGINEYLNLQKNERFEVKNIKQMLKYADVNRILTAYKLFYVGCSRAKDELVLIVDKEKIKKYEKEFKNRFRDVGFIVD